MDDIDKIEQLFKANEVVLAVQLCKSQGYNLRELLGTIFEKDGFRNYTEDIKIWSLNNLDYMDDLFTGISNNYVEIILWVGFIDDNFEYRTLDEYLDKLTEELYKLCK